MSKAKKLHKKSKAKFNAFCGGGARSSKVKQDQARSSKVSRVRSLKREFIKRVAAEANSPEAVRKI
ncbi:hypothetical protein ICR34_001070 [Campylobacter upsaliensis]|nr:hypothetical protein [Campylobacter upsaliensis]